MLDLKFIREYTNELKSGIAKKKFTCDMDAFIAIDNERRELLTHIESLKAQQNIAGDSIKNLDKTSPEFHSKINELRIISDNVKNLETQFQKIEEQWKALYLSIPNIPHASVPTGKSADDNQTIATWGDIDRVSPFAVPHYDISWFNQLIDFPRGVKVTGAGFPFYIGDGARVVRGLITFFLNEAKANGYTELMAPIMVNSDSATATGQLPDKEGQMYHNDTDNFYMIPTAEVPVTNFFRDEIFDESELPIYRCGYTPCFRREAGSWGKDVRGLNRLHQFDKVELVKWTHPNDSFQELEKLRHDAEMLLQKMELPYRVLSICTGDIGFPHSKQYDLEVWSGGQNRWLEVSSCSNFTDFQARRAGIKFREKVTGKSTFVHTLNGSGLAIPRVLAAILENNLQENETVLLPKVLQEFVGKEKIGPVK
ncbi:MAG: serine--tRNA ligase [Puniceicoccales bacterium]|jgi:seryl-tRNA synthetase|nr:serine--tRNA ligase [Puniceicoccales bacterium]